MTVTDESTTPEGALIQPESEETVSQSPESDGHSLLDRLRFWRRGQTWLEIVGYHVEDIYADQPVAIQEDATLVGNVFAPRLVVAGLLTGSAMCREIKVEKSGQILGDVFTVALTVISGGHIHGWISSTDEEGYAQLVELGQLPDRDKLIRHENGRDRPESHLLTRNEAQVEALHQLQSEAAVALAARAELEQDFQRRLTELAGESTSTIANLKQELTELRTELTTKKTQLDEAQEALRHRKNQVERQANELGIARDLMTEQNEELTNLRQQHTQLQSSHVQMQTEKTAVDEKLAAAVTEINALRDRIHSLEVAHKASLVHTSEQEESLIRWQELAEITERRAAELEGELQKVQLQVEESSNTIDLLREQRRAAEKELEKTVAALNNSVKQGSSPVNAKLLKAAEAKIAALEAELADAEHAHFERILRYKAELEDSQTAASATKEEMAAQIKKLASLEETVTAQKKAIDKWKTAAAEAQADLEAKQAEWNAQQEKLVEQNMGLQAALKEQRMHLQDSENEQNRYLQEATAQGKHLAEIQVRLVERELQLKKAIAQLAQARSMIEKQNEAIKQIQLKAGQRIRSLQSQLTR